MIIKKEKTSTEDLLAPFRKAKESKPIYFIAIIFAASFVFLIALILRWSVVERLDFVANIIKYLSIFAVCVVSLWLVYFLLSQIHSDVAKSIKLFAAAISVVTLTLIISIFMELLSPFAVPVTLAVLLIAVFTDTKVSFICNTFTVLLLYITLSSFGDENMQQWFITLMIFALISGTMISYSIKRDTTRLSFILNGIAYNLLAVPFTLLNVALFDATFNDVARLLPFMIFMVFGSVFGALVFQPIIESVFNVNSNFRLIELCDHHRPLLMRLNQEAPGTFTHSQTVAILAETCARAINENTYFVKAAAYYHDVGKLKNTRFFKENQRANSNPHDELTPEVSVEIIKQHALNGIEICKEYRIPREISVITAEHHGTMPIIYFYEKAKKLTDRPIDIKDYSYIGPIPSSKAAAIIMICDAAEATVRALPNHSHTEIKKAVQKIIEERLMLGQFDDCGITMKELATIRDTIVNAFGGLYHEREKYPDLIIP